MSRLVPGVNDLQTWCYENNRLDLLEEWDYKRNFPLTPSQISRGSGKRVYWVCKTCGRNWPRSVGGRTNPNGSGCRLCNQSTPPPKKSKYTSENFQKYIDEKGVNIELLSPFIDLDTNVMCQCKTCGHIWEPLPTNLLSGHGCKICGIEKAASARRGSLEKVQEVIGSAGLKITVSGVYKNQGSSLTCFCEVCNSQWEIQAKILLAKIRKGINPCTACNRIEEQRQMAIAFLEKVKQINPDVKVLTAYIKTDEHVQCECLICGHIYPVLPLNLLKGRRCPQCALQKASDRLRDSHDTFLEKLAKVHSNIRVVGKYENQNTRVECECLNCGNVWNPVPYHLLSGVGCPDCQKSHGEKLIQTYLENRSIQFESQKRFDDCRYKYTLPFDFYLPQLNMCIEYDGIQHYEAREVFGGEKGLEETQKRDQIKSDYCNQKGLRLLRIPYYADALEILRKVFETHMD